MGKPGDTGPRWYALGQGLGTGQVASPELGEASRERSHGSLIRAHSLLALPWPAAMGSCFLSVPRAGQTGRGRPHELLWLRVVTGVRRWWDPSCHTEGV